jgi:hypothetical protein
MASTVRTVGNICNIRSQTVVKFHAQFVGKFVVPLHSKFYFLAPVICRWELQQLSLHIDGLRARRPEFDFRHGKEICLYSIGCRSALRSNQPPIHWGLGALGKAVGARADHSLPTSAEVKNGGAIPQLFVRLHGVVLTYVSTGTTLALLLVVHKYIHKQTWQVIACCVSFVMSVQLCPCSNSRPDE